MRTSYLLNNFFCMLFYSSTSVIINLICIAFIQFCSAMLVILTTIDKIDYSFFEISFLIKVLIYFVLYGGGCVFIFSLLLSCIICFLNKKQKVTEKKLASFSNAFSTILERNINLPFYLSVFVLINFYLTKDLPDFPQISTEHFIELVLFTGLNFLLSFCLYFFIDFYAKNVQYKTGMLQDREQCKVTSLDKTNYFSKKKKIEYKYSLKKKKM